MRTEIELPLPRGIPSPLAEKLFKRGDLGSAVRQKCTREALQRSL
jgi:hypothetical protein